MVKLLVIKIDSELNFNEHVSSMCKKTSKKIQALARISNVHLGVSQQRIEPKD